MKHVPVLYCADSSFSHAISIQPNICNIPGLLGLVCVCRQWQAFVQLSVVQEQQAEHMAKRQAQRLVQRAFVEWYELTDNSPAAAKQRLSMASYEQVRVSDGCVLLFPCTTVLHQYITSH